MCDIVSWLASDCGIITPTVEGETSAGDRQASEGAGPLLKILMLISRLKGRDGFSPEMVREG